MISLLLLDTGHAGGYFFHSVLARELCCVQCALAEITPNFDLSLRYPIRRVSSIPRIDWAAWFPSRCVPQWGEGCRRRLAADTANGNELSAQDVH